MAGISAMSFRLVADSSSAITAMRDYVGPTIRTLSALAAIASVFFLINAGYLYMTSAGKPETLDHAKRVMRNALLGLVIVFSALTLTSILTHSYGQTAAISGATLPSLQALPPDHVSSALIDILVKSVTGLLNNIIQTVATPFLAGLKFFTTSTPLMAANPSVFNLWLAMVGMTDVLFTVVLALIGLHVMGAASFGFEEIEFKHLLPRIGLVFLLLNSSIFIIDGVIALSNAMITAIGHIGGASSVWDGLTLIVKSSAGQGVGALLVMLAFLILVVMLLVYYVGRLVTLYIGTVLSPVVFLVWLVPGFRDFSEAAIKTYIATVFTLFVHVVILQLAASLLAGVVIGSGGNAPDPLMAMIVGLATVMALLKTQGVMMQFSYVSMGSRNARRLSSTFMNGVSYIGGQGKRVVSSVTTKSASRSNADTASGEKGGRSVQSSSYRQPHDAGTRPKSTSKGVKTGVTYEAPKVASRTAPKTKKANDKEDRTT